MKKLEFKTFKFKEMITNGSRTFVCVEEVQSKYDVWLAEVMKDAVVVYDGNDGMSAYPIETWSRVKHDDRNHRAISSNFTNSRRQALLIDIREIEKVCKHEKVDRGLSGDYWCTNCDKRLEATGWKAVE